MAKRQRNFHNFNRIFFHSAEHMEELASDSVQLAISFPPFLHTSESPRLDKHALLAMLQRVHEEVFRVLSADGFLVSINTDVRDRPDYDDTYSAKSGTIWWKHQSIRETCERIGFRCVGTKIWVRTLKQNLYRFTYSHIVFYSKGCCSLSSTRRELPRDFRPDVWLLEGQTAYKLQDGTLFRDCLHPILAERCIRQLSDPGGLVLVPFAGVGTVPDVARRLGRMWVGYEISERLRSTLRTRLGQRAVRLKSSQNPYKTPN